MKRAYTFSFDEFVTEKYGMNEKVDMVKVFYQKDKQMIMKEVDSERKAEKMLDDLKNDIDYDYFKAAGWMAKKDDKMFGRVLKFDSTADTSKFDNGMKSELKNYSDEPMSYSYNVNEKATREDDGEKVIFAIDKPSDVDSKEMEKMVMSAAREGLRSNQLFLKMKFITADKQDIINRFQKLKNKVYFESAKNESLAIFEAVEYIHIIDGNEAMKGYRYAIGEDRQQRTIYVEVLEHSLNGEIKAYVAYRASTMDSELVKLIGELDMTNPSKDDMKNMTEKIGNIPVRLPLKGTEKSYDKRDIERVANHLKDALDSEGLLKKEKK